MEHFLNNAQVGSAGDSNSSGWMKEARFVRSVKYFVEHSKPLIQRPTVLLDKGD
jgi:hypothetical protein